MKKTGLKILFLLMALSMVLAMGCQKEAPPPPPPPPAPAPPDPCADLGDPFDAVIKGGWAMDCKCYDQAIVLLTCAIDSGQLDNRFLAMAYNLRGLTYYKKGDCGTAKADLTAAIDMFPLYDAAYLNRAAANKACGFDKEAAWDYAMWKKLAAKAKAKGWKPFKRLWPKGECAACPM